MWLVYCFGANILAAVLEYIYRTQAFANFWVALPKLIIPIVLIQFCFFYSLRLAPSMMIAGVTFSVTNLVFRTITMYKAGDVVDWRVGVAVFLMLCALGVQKIPIK